MVKSRLCCDALAGVQCQQALEQVHALLRQLSRWALLSSKGLPQAVVGLLWEFDLRDNMLPSGKSTEGKSREGFNAIVHKTVVCTSRS